MSQNPKKTRKLIVAPEGPKSRGGQKFFKDEFKRIRHAGIQGTRRDDLLEVL